MYTCKIFSKQKLKIFSGFVSVFTAYDNCFHYFRQEEIEKAAAFATAYSALSLAEGLAIGALIHGRIGFMGTHQNLVQRAVVLVLTVVSARLDGAFDALVCMAIHSQ